MCQLLLLVSSIFQTTYVLMRDKIKLAVDYIVVSKTERFPVILELTPYGRGPRGVNYRYEASYWLEHGYIQGFPKL
jgi:predicted acyl esterase